MDASLLVLLGTLLVIVFNPMTVGNRLTNEPVRDDKPGNLGGLGSMECANDLPADGMFVVFSVDDRLIACC